MCAVAAPFPAFRFVHLEHHKHTNDPALDPDHYRCVRVPHSDQGATSVRERSGEGPKVLLPLHWLTQVRRKRMSTIVALVRTVARE